jgi:hypothetical protein
MSEPARMKPMPGWQRGASAWMMAMVVLAAIPCPPVSSRSIVLSARDLGIEGFRTDRADFYTSHSPKDTTAGPLLPPVKQIDDLVFVMGQGSGLDGYTTLRIEENGDGELLVDMSNSATPNWQLIRFQATVAAVADLKRLLIDVGYFTLPESYNTDVQDGGQWYVKVKCHAAKKSVYCNNHFPEPVRKVSDFLRDRILPTAMASKQVLPVTNWKQQWQRLSDGSETY